MVKVECEGCKAPYEIDERRIPASGLKMRCPKCGTSVLVQKPGGAAPAPAAPPRKPPPPAATPPIAAQPPRPEAAPTPGFGAVDPFGDGDDGVDLPAMPDPDAPDLPAMRVAPAPAPRPPPPAAPAMAPPPRPLGGFGEIDLMVDSGSAGEVDLPSAAPAAPGLSFGQPAPMGAIDLPSARQAPPPVPPRGAPPPPRPPQPEAPSIDVNQGFGSIDHGFGAIDLPAARDPRAAAPQVSAIEMGGGDFGAVDLPIVSGADQQPRFGARVPPPPQRGGPPPQAAGLPTPFQGAGGAALPAPVAASYGGLPSPPGRLRVMRPACPLPSGTRACPRPRPCNRASRSAPTATFQPPAWLGSPCRAAVCR
ncbi:MAG: zinc-ribbon domain-containing protein [Polyangiaceae bacterium]